MPLVSVVIPTYNSAQYVTAAVNSVRAQTVRDVEILVVDDGSTDDTREVMKQYGALVRYFSQENGGVAVARNHGIAESSGRYIAFLDADDTWSPHKLEQQLAVLEANPRYRLCYSAHTSVDAQLTPLGVGRSERHGPALEDLLLHGNIVGSICTVLCERELFKTGGVFDPELSQCADWDMWIRLAMLTEFLYLDEPLVTYRQHAANMSRNAPLLEHDSLRVLRKAFDTIDLPESLLARRRESFGRAYRVFAGTYFHAGSYRDFLRCAVRAVMLDFNQTGYLMAFPARALGRLRQRHIAEVE